MTTVLSSDVSVSEAELERRTIRRSAWVPCNAAFIDCRTPGSDQKENYAFIGSGVAQNPNQFVNLEENHGFNTGAAGMPNGISNNLHMHFTAEVFTNLGGEFRLRWGVNGEQGEYVSHDGDIITVPTWIFRGFTNEGPDDGILWTVLGRDDTGGIIWGPSVLKEAESYGLHLTADNVLIDTVAGDVLPASAKLITPMQQHYIDELSKFTLEEFRSRVIQPGDRRYSDHALLCNAVPGGKAELALAIGYGMSQDRRQTPNVHEPHSFSMAWVRAVAGEGVLRHRHERSQAVLVKAGTWNLVVDGKSVVLGAGDSLSIVEGAWREFLCTDAGDGGVGELLITTQGDDRVYLEWAPEVVDAAYQNDWTIDANGYVAPVGVMITATADD